AGRAERDARARGVGRAGDARAGRGDHGADGRLRVALRRLIGQRAAGSAGRRLGVVGRGGAGFGASDALLHLVFERADLAALGRGGAGLRRLHVAAGSHHGARGRRGAARTGAGRRVALGRVARGGRGIGRGDGLLRSLGLLGRVVLRGSGRIL